MAAKKKAVSKTAPVKVLSDKEIVLKKFKDAECMEAKIGLFHICTDCEESAPTAIHSGFAKSEGDAWKLAAHAVL